MKQIEQALRKAREQRRITPVAPTPLLNHMPAFSVTYTQTKVVAVTAGVLEESRVVAMQLTNPVTDVYRALRAQVLQSLTRLGKSTLGVTSIGASEGKTLTAINLAFAIAMDVNQTVLLVDADLRNPGVGKCLGLDNAVGLGDCLSGRASVGECLINPGVARLTVLPARGTIDNSAELLTSPKMAELTRELKSRYPDRIIIYDLPPLLTVGDTIGFLPNVESTILVVRDGKTRPSELQRAVALLSGYNLIGTVLNAVK